MKRYTQDISVNAIQNSLKNKRIRRNILRIGYQMLENALTSVNCCTNPINVTLNAQSFQETNFLSLIKDAILRYTNNRNFRNTLIKLQEIVNFHYLGACCAVDTLIEINSNHPAIATLNRGTEGYSSIQSGGDTTDFEYIVSGACTPYTVELSFNFGGGNIIYRTDSNINDESFTVNISNLMDSFLGKQVNITGTPRTVIANNLTPTGSEYNLNILNGRSPIATVTVTDCIGNVSTSTYKVEFEMKRVSQMFLYKRLLGVTEANCGCAETMGDIYADRRGGGNINPVAPSNLLGDTMTAFSLSGQNIFNTYFTGSVNAKWKTSDTWNALGGFHTNITFRTPTVQVVDSFVTSGTVTDIGCIYTSLFLNTDIRDDDTMTVTPVVYFSSTPCPVEPFTFGSSFNYSVSSSAYQFNKPLMQVGDIIILGSDTATIQNVATPATLGW